MYRRIPLIVCFIFGAFMLIQFFVPHRVSTEFYEMTLEWAQIIYAFALLVGALMLMKHHAVNATRKSSDDRPFSIIVIAGIATMCIAGLIWGHGEGTVFNWFFQNVQAPMQSTMFSLLAFFVASAAFRGFRARNTQAIFLLIAATIVMLGRVPIGELISPVIPQVADWILNVPSMAARRGIYIGIALGSIATSLRVILGIERTYLGGS
ncbi:MAG: hypothetical protein GF315_10855 [candidate division Zixibacteria bacterium]|nr:hypothetical protein [candidate division Zixibacteria bacterium]